MCIYDRDIIRGTVLTINELGFQASIDPVSIISRYAATRIP